MIWKFQIFKLRGCYFELVKIYVFINEKFCLYDFWFLIYLFYYSVKSLMFFVVFFLCIYIWVRRRSWDYRGIEVSRNCLVKQIFEKKIFGEDRVFFG